jgi:hypothetical protein
VNMIVQVNICGRLQVKDGKQNVKEYEDNKAACRDSVAGEVSERTQIWKERWNNKTSSKILLFINAE